jgi:hypothetical protein
MRDIIGLDFCGTLVSRQTLQLVILNAIIPMSVIERMRKMKITRYILKLIERIAILIMPYRLFHNSLLRNLRVIRSDFNFELFDSKENIFIISASASEIISATLYSVNRDCPIIAATFNCNIVDRYLDFIYKPCRAEGKIHWFRDYFNGQSVALAEFHTDSDDDDPIGSLAAKYVKEPTSERFKKNDCDCKLG